MFKKTSLAFLVLCICVANSLYAEWLSPISSISPSGNWTNGANAYDTNTSTYASDNFLTTGWGGYLEMNMPTNVTCNQIKVRADFGQGGVDTANIEVYNVRTASWNSVVNGSINDGAWSYVTFNPTYISKIRFRYHYYSTGLVFWLYEIAAWDAGVAATPATVLTKMTSSEDDGGSILHGQILDDGNEPCQYRFEYGLSPAYGQATTWTGQLITNDTFSKQLTGLAIGQYYHYRAEAKNSAGTSYGEDRYFWSKQPNTGWLSPTGDTDTQNVWENRSNAHDDNTDTYARAFTAVGDPSVWSPFLYLSHTAITSNALKFYARIDGTVDETDIDVYYNGTWNNVYQGAASNNAYVIKSFPTASVTEARIRFHKSGNFGMYYELHDLSFYKLGETLSNPVITVNSVMDLIWVDDLIMESGESTTKFIIRRNINELYLGKLKIDGPALTLSYTEDYTGIIVTKNSYGLPMLVVPSTNNSFGAFINNNPSKNVLLEFNLEKAIQPLIMIDTGSGLRTVTTFTGKEKTGTPAEYQNYINTFNYTESIRRLTFYTDRVCTYSIGAVASVTITPNNPSLSLNGIITLNIKVVDSLGAGVEEAPITVSIVSGGGVLSAVNLTTDILGNTSVGYAGASLPEVTVIRVLCDSIESFSTLNIRTMYTLDMWPNEKIITPSSILSLTINVTANETIPAAGVPVTITIISGGGLLSTTNARTNASGNIVFSYTAPAYYTTAQIKAEGAGFSKTNTIYVQTGIIRYVPLGYGGIPSYNTIQNALNACSAGDVVQINNGTYTENLNWPNVSNIILRGDNDSGSANCIINGNQTSQVIYCGNGVTLSIRNLQLRGGRNTLGTPAGRLYGGGITVYNTTGIANLDLYQVLITGNTATARANTARDLGGGVYFYGRNININNCTIASNNARVGGAIYLNGGTLAISNSIIKQNHTTVGEGGGLFLANTSATKVSITDTIFDSNRATTDGGGARFNDTASINITAVTFNANQAANGGATDQGYFAIYNNCSFYNNQATTNGGVFNMTSVSLNDCLLSGNQAINGSGGVMYVNNLPRTSTINACNFINNKATTNLAAGGCFRSNTTTSILKISNSSFENNQAYQGGCFYNNTVLLDRCWLENNSATNAGGVFYTSLTTANNCLFVSNNGGTVGGGVIYSSLNNLFMNCTFVSNNATTARLIYVSGGTPRITNSVIYGCPTPFGASTVPVVAYTRLDATYVGAGNITSNPQFLNDSLKDFHLDELSDCVDTGTNTGAPAIDYDGLMRPRNINTDMGAYETTPAASVVITKNITVKAQAEYIANGGGETDPVPGSTISHMYTFNNFGKAAAEVVIFSDVIPGSTSYVSGSATCSLPAVISYQHATDEAYDNSQALPVTSIRWTLSVPLPVNATGSATMNVSID